MSCTAVIPPDGLALHQWNIVVHASDLPHDRGFSPLVWKILEGKNTIPLTMITMGDVVDSGDIVMERQIEFQGHELNDEMRDRMGQAIVEMCFNFATNPTKPEERPQKGTPSLYRRRHPSDSQLNVKKSIADQFNLLRVVDNRAYPAFFDYLGHRYNLTIERQVDKGLDT